MFIRLLKQSLVQSLSCRQCFGCGCIFSAGIMLSESDPLTSLHAFGKKNVDLILWLNGWQKLISHLRFIFLRGSAIVSESAPEGLIFNGLSLSQLAVWPACHRWVRHSVVSHRIGSSPLAPTQSALTGLAADGIRIVPGVDDIHEGLTVILQHSTYLQSNPAANPQTDELWF